MPSLRHLFAGAVLATAALLAGATQANVITIVNASFESAPTGGYISGPSGAYSMGNVPGWSSVTPANAPRNAWGVWQPPVALAGVVPDGTNILYVDDYPVTQLLSVTAIANVTYTMVVSVGYGVGVNNFGAGELVIGGIPHAGAASTTVQQQSNLWYTVTTTYKATAGDAGKAILISLNPNGPARGQALFDNIRLSDDYVAPPTPPTSAAPEPTAWALMMLGFGAVGAGLRHRRRFAQI